MTTAFPKSKWTCPRCKQRTDAEMAKVCPACKAKDADVRSPLKWAGGKHWFVPELREFYAPFRSFRFVDLFCGGLSATLGVRPYAALANDSLFPLINFYRQLQRGLTIPEWPNTAEDYARLRDRFNVVSNQPTVESAALFYYLNRTGFNGLCRFSAAGRFNTPYGRGDTLGKNTLTPLGDYRDALASVDFLCGDYRDAFDRCGKEDFIYADPPYDTEFTSYAPGGFDWSCQEELAALLSQASGPVVASNQATPRIVALYERRGFTLAYREVRRSIRSHATEGGKTAARTAMEVIAVNDAALSRWGDV